MRVGIGLHGAAWGCMGLHGAALDLDCMGLHGTAWEYMRLNTGYIVVKCKLHRCPTGLGVKTDRCWGCARHIGVVQSFVGPSPGQGWQPCGKQATCKQNQPTPTHHKLRHSLDEDDAI